DRREPAATHVGHGSTGDELDHRIDAVAPIRRGPREVIVARNFEVLRAGNHLGKHAAHDDGYYSVSAHMNDERWRRDALGCIVGVELEDRVDLTTEIARTCREPLES